MYKTQHNMSNDLSFEVSVTGVKPEGDSIIAHSQVHFLHDTFSCGFLSSSLSRANDDIGLLITIL